MEVPIKHLVVIYDRKNAENCHHMSMTDSSVFLRSGDGKIFVDFEGFPVELYMSLEDGERFAKSLLQQVSVERSNVNEIEKEVI